MTLTVRCGPYSLSDNLSVLGGSCRRSTEMFLIERGPVLKQGRLPSEMLKSKTSSVLNFFKASFC